MAGILGAVSCSDMLESESNGQLYDPSLSEKTDSTFYAYGVLQAMQQLADQYYFQNEMRGELVTTSKYATKDLRSLNNFEADASNKYDSVYLYYKVINNCNYYLKHRKTDLVTGSTYVTMNEYIAIASIRAWAYLQLVRNYDAVPYVTEPVTSVSEINSLQQVTPASTILASEAEYLENLKKNWDPSYWEVPNYGVTTDRNLGANGARDHYYRPEKCFVPLNVVLGDLYLENGQYENAAKAYYDYIYYTSLKGENKLNINYANELQRWVDNNTTEVPSDMDMVAFASLYTNSAPWNNIFDTSSMPGDVITYIPMAASTLNGQVTEIPEAFGYLYYNGANGGIHSKYTFRRGSTTIPESDIVPVMPTKEFQQFYSTTPYYYQQILAQNQRNADITSQPLGDTRFNFVTNGYDDDSMNVYVSKPANANIYLYRTSTVYLHLAEAMNRMGHPDAAFAVLKTGLVGNKLKQFIDTAYIEKPENPDPTTIYYDKDVYFLSSSSAKMLSTFLHFLPAGTEGGGDDGSGILKDELYNVGIHFHGAGACTGTTLIAKQSPYKFSTVLGLKLAELNNKFNLGLTQYTLADSINAMEDILCDEYALELAFEGCRFGDLQRMARHKNESGIYGGAFGDAWLSEKLKGKGKVITTKNCYLPFK